MIDLWSEVPCVCPNIEYDKRYIIMGKEGKDETMQFAPYKLYDSKTIVVLRTKRNKGKRSVLHRLLHINLLERYTFFFYNNNFIRTSRLKFGVKFFQNTKNSKFTCGDTFQMKACTKRRILSMYLGRGRVRI